MGAVGGGRPGRAAARPTAAPHNTTNLFRSAGGSGLNPIHGLNAEAAQPPGSEIRTIYMTKKELKIGKAILLVLHELEGGQINDSALHAEVNLMHDCTRTEFEAALAKCDAAGWIMGWQSRFKGRLWSMRDMGEAVLAEL